MESRGDYYSEKDRELSPFMRKARWAILFVALFMGILIYLENVSADEIVQSFTVHQIGPFRTGQVITLTQTCPNCTFVNVTRVTFPNSTQLFINTRMAQPVLGNFNTSFSLTQDNGQYVVTTCGNPDGVYDCDDYTFVINLLGKVLTEAQARLYSLILIIGSILFLICITLGFYLPSDNKKDELTGYIIAVSNLKYLKMFFLATSYLVFMLIVYFGYTICLAYLDLDALGSILYFLFYVLVYLIIPLFIVGVYLVITNQVRDSQVEYQLSRGFEVK